MHKKKTALQEINLETQYSMQTQVSSNFIANREIIGEPTLSASQTLTVLSNEDVARRGMLGLKRTSVIKFECSSSEVFDFNVSVYHKTACIIYQSQHLIRKKAQLKMSIAKQFQINVLKKH